MTDDRLLDRAKLIAVFTLGVTVSSLMFHRRKPVGHFEPLEPIAEPPRLVTSYPRRPPPPTVVVVDDTVFHDGELEGWFPPPLGETT